MSWARQKDKKFNADYSFLLKVCRPAGMADWLARPGWAGHCLPKKQIAALRVCIVSAVGTWHCKTEQKRFLAPNDVKSEAGHVSASQDSESETFSD